MTYRGRIHRGEQWSFVAEKISSRVSLEDYTALLVILLKTNIADKLTIPELVEFEEFLVAYAEAVKRRAALTPNET